MKEKKYIASGSAVWGGIDVRRVNSFTNVKHVATSPFPGCCGATIVSDLGTTKWELGEIKALLTKLAKGTHAIAVITMNGTQYKVLGANFKKAGFKAFQTGVNKIHNSDIHLLAATLHKRKVKEKEAE
jgi:hypothetical protein